MLNGGASSQRSSSASRIDITSRRCRNTGIRKGVKEHRCVSYATSSSASASWRSTTAKRRRALDDADRQSTAPRNVVLDEPELRRPTRREARQDCCVYAAVAAKPIGRGDQWTEVGVGASHTRGPDDRLTSAGWHQTAPEWLRFVLEMDAPEAWIDSDHVWSPTGSVTRALPPFEGPSSLPYLPPQHTSTAELDHCAETSAAMSPTV